MNRVFWDVTIPAFAGFGLHFRLDGFRLVYCVIAVFMWAVSGIFSREYMAHYENRRRYYIYFWATFLATTGVFLSADLYSTFIFFEIMSFTSYVWVAFDQRKESLRAAQTYLAVAVIGGMVMLMGLFLLYDQFRTLEIDALGDMAAKVMAAGGPEAARLYTAGGLLLFGFGAKAGCFPLHIWLPKAHPEAPAPASALLSGILTKAGIFGVIVVSCVLFGTDRNWGLLITGLGFVTMLLGAVLAVFSVNLKRTLACSSISQIGFILTGIGMTCLLKSAGESGVTAARGAFLHMVNHSLLKLVLFLCAGVVYMNLHKLDLNDIRGFGKKKPAFFFCFLMGAAGIGGIPLWNGYVSKTLIHEGILEYMQISAHPMFWKAAEAAFLTAGGMTVAYMLKLFAVLFLDGKAQEEGRPYMRRETAAALVPAAAVLPVLGVGAGTVMDRIADLGQGFFRVEEAAHPVAYFSFENIKGGAVSIVIGVLIYAVVVRGILSEKDGENGRRYLDLWPRWLDLEELLYRPVIEVALPSVLGAVCRFVDRYLVSSAVTVFLGVSAFVSRCMDSMVDFCVRILRRTTHSQIKEAEAYDSNLAAHLLGNAADAVYGAYSRLPWRKGRAAASASGRESAAVRLSRKEDRIKYTGRLIHESFSYGLMLVCIGMVLTLGYLLLEFFGIL